MSSGVARPDSTAEGAAAHSRGEALDFSDVITAQDPYPTYARLQTAAPVHRASAGRWAVLRHGDCMDALTHHARWRADPVTVSVTGSPIERVQPILQQALAHTGLRLQPHVEELSHDLLDLAMRKAEFDLINEFAELLPMRMIADLLGGVPTRDQGYLRHAARELAHLLAPECLVSPAARDAAQSVLSGVGRYLDTLIAQRSTSRGDDLISALLSAEDNGERLGADEVRALLVVILVAVQRATVNLLANGALALVRNPRQADALASDAHLAPGAVDEVLRFDAPVQVAAGRAANELRVGDSRIDAGEAAVFVIAAANRDPEVFDTPQEFDLTRADAERRATLGGDAQLGPAPSLTRTVAETALRTVAGRVPAVEIASPPRYCAGPALRCPDGLYLRRRGLACASPLARRRPPHTLDRSDRAQSHAHAACGPAAGA